VKKEVEEDRNPHWNWDIIGSQMQQGLQTTLNATLMKRFLAVMPEADPQYKYLTRVRDALTLTNPAEWHPIARQVHRKVIMHVGPTNSGKTYHALRALAASEAGLYAGPLRLLATEIFGRLNKGDIAPTGGDTSIPHPRVCNLLTGEEQRIIDPDAPLISATVEMVPLTKKFDVVVIDEIQMIASPDRGNAWTQALLGLNANEIHLCGEESAVPLVKQMLKGCGDELIINRYERLTPLEIAPKSLEGVVKRVQPGDCVIAFSKANIFALKTLIEEETGLKCAVVYGRLPPEVRVEQAEKFNKGLDNYSVLVASDAIGMGLNL
jgi:ATP-dependent RNA helicase SUPV3L1/SUV3